MKHLKFRFFVRSAGFFAALVMLLAGSYACKNSKPVTKYGPPPSTYESEPITKYGVPVEDIDAPNTKYGAPVDKPEDNEV
jgi:hypothetical protein